MVQIIPFRREEWSSSLQIKEPKTFIDNMSDYTSEYSKEKTNSVSLHVEYDMEREKQRKEIEIFNLGEFEIVEITGVVKVLFVRVWVSVNVATD